MLRLRVRFSWLFTLSSRRIEEGTKRHSATSALHSKVGVPVLFSHDITVLFCFLLLMCCFGTLCMSGQQVTSLKEIWPCSRTIYYLQMINLHACLFVKKSLCRHETLMSGVVKLTYSNFLFNANPNFVSMVCSTLFLHTKTSLLFYHSK